MMKFKKAIASIMMVLMLLFLMCACGEQGGNEDETAVTLPEDETESTTDGEDSLVLTVVNGYSLNDVGSKTLTAFCDYIEEETDGAVTFDRYFGGTMCSLPEEFGLVSSGAVDVITLLQDFVMAEMPLCNIPGSTQDDQMGGINYWRYIMFENEETANLIAEEAAEQNVIFLDVQSGGIGAYVCRQPFTSWADLGKYKFGAVRNSNIYEGLGLSCVSADTTDAYDSLSRGVYDSCGMGIGSVISNKWYEVAPYMLACKGFSATNYLTVNLDTWNKLTEEQQEIFRDAAELAAQMSVDLNLELMEQAETLCEENGGSFGWFSDDDSKAYNELQFEAIAESVRTYAQTKGNEDDFNVIYDACCEYLGY